MAYSFYVILLRYSFRNVFRIQMYLEPVDDRLLSDICFFYYAYIIWNLEFISFLIE